MDNLCIMTGTAVTKNRSHAGAGVPWRRPSTPVRGPSFFGPSCVSGQKGTVVYGSYVDESLALITPTAKYYYHANHLYSVAALTNGAGAVMERYRYDTFGNRTVLAADGVTPRAASSHNQQIGFTGRYLDKETGLWYFRARYYSGSLGQFIGRDPLGYVDGSSLYQAYFTPNALDYSGMGSIHVEVGMVLYTTFDIHTGSTNFPVGPAGIGADLSQVSRDGKLIRSTFGIISEGKGDVSRGFLIGANSSISGEIRMGFALTNVEVYSDKTICKPCVKLLITASTQAASASVKVKGRGISESLSWIGNDLSVNTERWGPCNGTMVDTGVLMFPVLASGTIPDGYQFGGSLTASATMLLSAIIYDESL